MVDILSQEEIDALIASFTAPAAVAREKEDVPHKKEPGQRKRIRVYDFRRPDKFSKDQLRTLQLVHENLGRAITTSFSAMFRSMVQVAVTSVDQLTFEEATQTMSNPTVVAVISLEPLKGKAILEINPSLAFPMIDRLLGGMGHMPSELRALTEIEQTVIERVIRGFLVNLREAWQNVVEFRPRLEGIETNPLLGQIVAPSEIVVMISFEVRVGEQQGMMNLCFPFIVIEPVLPRLSAQHWFTAQRESSLEALEALKRRVELARVPVTVRLGETKLTVREFLELEVGDVVRLETTTKDEMKVFVNERLKFYGRPGLVARRLAVQVTRIAGEGDD